uniref:CSON003346 protein n=1 Tax=Culicoides sonorensis TaxID=179676 RepID=A0A336JX36_CULSO
MKYGKTKNRRRDRLKSMVPVELITKEYCYVNIEESKFIPTAKQKAEVENHDIEHIHVEISQTETYSSTFKRGRLKRKAIVNCPNSISNNTLDIKGALPKFACEICEKSFLTLGKLETHQQCHLPKKEKELLKKHHCEYCSKTFKELNKLNNHRNFKHFKNYKFICETCGKPFINVSELKRHSSKSHNDKLPCTICGKLVLNVDLHYKDVHENSPKTCSICLEVLPNQKKLNKHRYVKHPFQLYECEICGKTYVEKFCYKKHLLEKHGIQISEF